MSGDYDENRYHRAMELLRVLCSNTCAAQEREKCQELTGHVGPINTGEEPRGRVYNVPYIWKTDLCRRETRVPALGASIGIRLGLVSKCISSAS